MDQLSGELGEARAETAALRARAAGGGGTAGGGSAAAAARPRQIGWAEANEERAAVLVAQLGKLKEGLTRRVIVQWSMRPLRCHKAWALYSLQRRLRRRLAARAPSRSAVTNGRAAARVAGQLLATIGDFFEIGDTR